MDSQALTRGGSKATKPRRTAPKPKVSTSLTTQQETSSLIPQLRAGEPAVDTVPTISSAQKKALVSKRASVSQAPLSLLEKFIRQRKLASIPDIRDAFGSNARDWIDELASLGKIREAMPGIYAADRTAADSLDVQRALSQTATNTSAIVQKIDLAMQSENMVKPSDLPDNLAKLAYWDDLRSQRSKAPVRTKPAIQRVYVEIAGYPTFYAERTEDKIAGRAGAISWKSNSPRLDNDAAYFLARKIFNPVPLFFDELMAFIPTDEPIFLPLIDQDDTHANLDSLVDPAPTSPDQFYMLPCAYTLGDTRRLDPAYLQHPLPEPVTLLVDHREPASIITALRRVSNLQVVRTELESGGYAVADRMVIERINQADFQDQLQCGATRLIRKAETLAATGLHRSLLIEGGYFAQRIIVLNRLVSTISYFQHVHGIHVTPTMNRQHTVYAIVQSIKHQLFGMIAEGRSPDPLEKRTVSSSPTSLVRLLLAYLPGISEDRAMALCDHFGTLRRIVSAELHELQQVKGIGRKTASEIHHIFNHHVS